MAAKATQIDFLLAARVKERLLFADELKKGAKDIKDKEIEKAIDSIPDEDFNEIVKCLETANELCEKYGLDDNIVKTILTINRTK